MNLKVVKNDSYEKGNDLMVVNVYMKGICRDTARVIFREQDFTLIFQTRYSIQGSTCTVLLVLQHLLKTTNDQSVFVVLLRDANFLRLHPDCGPNTVFRWQVKLR